MNRDDRLHNIIRFQNIISAIRHTEATDLKSLATHACVSWPTLKSSLDVLNNSGMIFTKEDNSPIKFVLNGTYCCFLGIAIGATETKISLTDFNFSPIDLLKDSRFSKLINLLEVRLDKSLNSDYLCFPTKADYLGIHNTCTYIIDSVVDFFESFSNINNDLTLMSIGISLPGIIDKNTDEMIFCPNIPSLVGMPVSKIIKTDTLEKLNNLGISYYICHDTTAATVFEKEHLYSSSNFSQNYKYKKNIAVLYLGYGFGSGYILDNSLVLGASGAVGELGHISMEYSDLPPTANESECHDKDAYLFNGIAQKNIDFDDPLCVCECHNKSCLERLIRVKVFNSNSIDDFKEKTTTLELSNFAKNHPYRYRVLKDLVGRALNFTVNMLNVDLVILSGRILNGIPELKYDIETIMNVHTLNASSKYCNIINGSLRLDSVAVGASILSYYNMITQSSKFHSLNINWGSYFS